MEPHSAAPNEQAASEKQPSKYQQVENVDITAGDLVYDDADHEPELHYKTYIALGAMFLLNLVNTFSVFSPPVALTAIGIALNNPAAQTWVPNALTLVQAVLCPLMSSASDVFQVRKPLLVGSLAVAVVGAGIAPGSQTIYRLIAAQVLIGVGFTSVALGYSIPSEILPRRWRPMGQAFINLAAAGGAIAGPVIMGALQRRNPEGGWRTFYWIEMGVWIATLVGVLVGYRPPKRHTRLDHLTFLQKVGHLDLVGFLLLTPGLTLLLVGLNLGGGLYSWTNVRVLGTLITGIAILTAFGLYEWKGTSTGILHHDLFRGGKDSGRNFAICQLLIFIEGIMLFAYVIFYPVVTVTLFESDSLLLAAREEPFWVACLVTNIIFGYLSTKFRKIKEFLSLGYLVFTGGIIGLATVQPSSSTNSVVFSGLAGAGFGFLIVLIVTSVQLSTPHHLIATATALTVSCRAIGAVTFTAIYAAAFGNRFEIKLPAYVAEAAVKAGLPSTSVKPFVEALATGNMQALSEISGIKPEIIGAGIGALKQAFVDSIRVIYIIAAPFGILACIACLFLGNMEKTMNYRVDAPMEEMKAKLHDDEKHGGSAAYGLMLFMFKSGDAGLLWRLRHVTDQRLQVFPDELL